MNKGMNNETDTRTNAPSLERNVMDAIRKGRVKMRPRWRYVLSSVLAALGGIILLLTLLYIVSFGIFTLRQTGALFVPVFGMQGVFAFFGAIPVVLIVLLVLFLIILEILVRRYAFAYRRPLLVSVAAILIIIFIGGYALERTRIHNNLFHQAHGPGGLPTPIGNMYHPSRVPDIYRGTIISVMPGGFVIVDENGAGTTTVLIDQATRLPLGADFAPGDEVVVFGDAASDSVRAFGIRTIGD
jgi:hypothetical protein